VTAGVDEMNRLFLMGFNRNPDLILDLTQLEASYFTQA